jgi:lipopolysaccharide/colanic/teichoic acid biosynthesis glycosyltransferase
LVSQEKTEVRGQVDQDGTHPPTERAGRSEVMTLGRFVSVVTLMALAPLLALIALAIRIDSRGPIFFRQVRVGLEGRPFRIFKFRTMVPDAETKGLGLAVARDDERITRVGRWLRRTSLDELPQLFNVAAGDMNIIGPRPTIPDQVAEYTRHQFRRLDVKPGLTGWAQVNGRNALRWEERIELDVWYIDHRSRSLDARILLRTPWAMIDSMGIYGRSGVTTGLNEEVDDGPA